jgi:hypothetical protein
MALGRMIRFLFSIGRSTPVLDDNTILLCLIKNSTKLYLMPSSKPKQTPSTLPIEQLRDLYERIPFVRGRGRAALLHQLKRVSLEVRQARVSSPKAPNAGSRAAENVIERAGDTSRC